MPCHDHKSTNGLKVNTFSGTWSGTQWMSDCNSIGNRQNVYHIVEIVNKCTYRIDVDCAGSISMTAQRKLQFNSPASTDTDHTWKDNISLGVNGQHTFDHVQLSNRNQGHGYESMYTDVNATSPSWGTTLLPVTLKFDVTV